MANLISYFRDQGHSSFHMFWFSIPICLHAKNEKNTLFQESPSRRHNFLIRIKIKKPKSKSQKRLKKSRCCILDLLIKYFNLFDLDDLLMNFSFILII